METKVNYLLIGLFVLLLGAGTISGIFWLGARPAHKNYNRYWVYMTESVSGLSPDASVKYKGVEIGRLIELKLDDKDPERVRLLLEVAPETPIKTDTLAVLEFHGITGLGFINLKPQSADSPPLPANSTPPYTVIQSGPSLFKRLDEGISELLRSMTKTSDNLNALLGGANAEDVGASVTNLKQLLASLASQAPTLNKLLQAATHTMVQSAKTSDQLPALLKQTQETLHQFQATGASMAALANDLGAQSTTVGQAAATSAAQLNGLTAEARLDLQTISQEILLLLQQIERLAATLEREPSTLLFGRPLPPPGPGE